jgi:hypothetical protein
MSETTEPDGTPAPESEPKPAPESTPPETNEPGPAKEAEDEEREKRSGDRRFAELSAKWTAAERDRAALRAENEYYRRQIAQQAPEQDTPEQAAQRQYMQVRAEVEAEIKVKNLHAEGYAQYPDWDQRRQRVVDMGGDARFARLIVDMSPSEAVKVVGALAEDPDALQRIVNLEGDHRRAMELGKYAATLDHDGGAPRAARTAPQVTRAPAPIRPVTGRAAPTFNEYTADGQTLVDVYMKRNLERRLQR